MDKLKALINEYEKVSRQLSEAQRVMKDGAYSISFDSDTGEFKLKDSPELVEQALDYLIRKLDEKACYLERQLDKAEGAIDEPT